MLSQTDLDGGTRTIRTPCSLITQSQVIRYLGDYFQKFSAISPALTGFGFQLNFGEVVIDDLGKYDIYERPVDIGSDPALPGGTDYDNSNLIGLFQAPWDGSYTFEVGAESSFYFGSSYAANFSGIYIRKVSNSSPLAATPDIPSTVDTYGSDTVRVHEGSVTLNLIKGEEVVIFDYRFSSGGADEIFFGRVRRKWKPDVAAATTTTIVLSGEQVIDGISTSSSRILVKDQGNIYENGIYISSSGAWNRASDSDTVTELINAAVYVTGGINNADSYYQQINEELSVLGADPIIWSPTDYDYEKERAYPGSGEPVNYLRVTANTTFPESYTPGFLIHDAALSICDRIIGKDDSFHSTLLGSSLTAIPYPIDGCHWANFISPGLQFRGYDLDEKPFSMSFNEWWSGLDPILNLGLGYDVFDDDEKIYVGNKSEFYDASSTSRDFYNLMFERQYDQDRNFNKIEIGFQQWQAENISGIDDPQTKHIYASRFKRTGKSIELYSSFIAASSAIEYTRRQSLQKTADYKYDNNVFIVALNPIPSDDLYPIPATYIPFLPEFDEIFASVSGITNPDKKYNLRYTPARNLLRWLPYINAGLQAYIGSEYTFQSGEGNFDMESDMLDTECDPAKFSALPLSEKQNIPVTNIVITVSTYSEGIDIPMTIEDFEAIDAERKKAIGISQTDSDPVKFLIDVMDYKIAEGQAVVSGWFKELYSLDLTTGAISQPICYGRFDAPCGNDAILAEGGDYLITEDGECIIME